MALVPHAPASNRIPLRGDYARAGADYLVDQHWARYSPAEHALWRRLFERQAQALPHCAAQAFRDGLQRLEVEAGEIPCLDRVGRRLEAISGWRLVGVPGLIPESRFFALLAARRFPVTVWMRRPEELDYLSEPDLFHDFFGHVPLLADPVFAAFVAAYGRRGTALAASRPALLKPLARLYWYGVEFGLLHDAGAGLRAFGAGILSSHAETLHSLGARQPLRLAFDLDRVLRTDYLIDGFQRTYFVLEDLGALFAAIDDVGFEARCAAAAEEPPIRPGASVAGDRRWPSSDPAPRDADSARPGDGAGPAKVTGPAGAKCAPPVRFAG